MNITVNSKREREVEVGDIIEYESTVRPAEYKHSTKRKHPFYMICRSKEEGYFVMSLTGQKDRLRFYKTLGQLLQYQTGVENIYSKKDWEMRLDKMGECQVSAGAYCEA